MRLRRPCEHDQYEAHGDVRNPSQPICPGGEFLADDTPDLLMSAWGVIANVSEGDWTRQTSEWQEAAAIWRANFHMILDALTVREGEG